MCVLANLHFITYVLLLLRCATCVLLLLCCIRHILKYMSFSTQYAMYLGYILILYTLYVGTFDFRPVPYGGDSSFVHQAMETLYYISRATGLSVVDTDHIQGMLRCTLYTSRCIHSYMLYHIRLYCIYNCILYYALFLIYSPNCMYIYSIC